MKTAISLPDDLFHAVEQIVRRSGRPRSAVYADALREYVTRNDPDEITEAINRAIDELGDAYEEEVKFTTAVSREALKKIEW